MTHGKSTRLGTSVYPNGRSKRPTPPLKSATQARNDLDARGVTIAQFARDHDIPYHVVQQVLKGRKKGRHGMAHNAAVLLGMKHGVIVADV